MVPSKWIQPSRRPFVNCPPGLIWSDVSYCHLTVNSYSAVAGTGQSDNTISQLVRSSVVGISRLPSGICLSLRIKVSPDGKRFFVSSTPGVDIVDLPLRPSNKHQNLGHTFLGPYDPPCSKSHRMESTFTWEGLQFAKIGRGEWDRCAG